MCYCPIDLRMWLFYKNNKKKNGCYSMGNMLDHLNFKYIETYLVILQLSAVIGDLNTEIFANMFTALQFSMSLMGFCRAEKIKLAQSPDV